MPTKEERITNFLSRAQKKHGTKYDYSKTIYTNNHTKIIIICPIHNEFSVTPNNFLSRDIGCPHCGRQFALEKKKNNYHREGCGTDTYNVRGGTKKYQHLVNQVFE